MSGPTVAILATLDTKESEARFLHERVCAEGASPVVVDIGLRLQASGLEPEVDADAVATAGGATVEQLRRDRRRDDAMAIMGRGAGALLAARHRAGTLDGVIAVGGNQGTAVAAIAMRSLPIGIPKVMVSTVASGNVRGYVEDSDITMMFSIGDLLGGPNRVVGRVLGQAAAATIAMSRLPATTGRPAAPAIGITAFGNTHRAVTVASDRLARAGYEVVPFHASGASGSAMERLLDDGVLDAVLDLTTHELLGELYPDDVYAPLRPRLTAAGRCGRAQVVVPGGLEYFCFGAAGSIPEHLRARPTHHHNPYNTNVRTSADELRAVAALMAERLAAATGPVEVHVPLHGWSEVASPGGPLHDPRANGALVETLQQKLPAEVPLHLHDTTINDPSFATAVADTLIELLRDPATSKEETR